MIAFAIDKSNSKRQFTICYQRGENSTMEIRDLRIDNLRALVEKAGSIAAFARQYEKVDPTYISQLLNGHRSFGEKAARNMEGRIGLTPGYLDAGHAVGVEPNVVEGPVLRARVPLISWVQAGNWCEAVDPLQPGDAEEWLFCPVSHGPSTFALRVRGVSMEPKYRDGAIIYIDPDRSADHLSNVVVRIEGESEVTFKQLVIEGDKRFLRPLNPDWPGPKLISIDSAAVICGVVIGQFIKD